MLGLVGMCKSETLEEARMWGTRGACWEHRMGGMWGLRLGWAVRLGGLERVPSNSDLQWQRGHLLLPIFLASHLLRKGRYTPGGACL